MIYLVIPIDVLGFLALAVETRKNDRFGQVQIVHAEMLLDVIQDFVFHLPSEIEISNMPN